ncbi:MAG: cupredoxin domain-containing protein [Thermoplasmata archaeon]
MASAKGTLVLAVLLTLSSLSLLGSSVEGRHQRVIEIEAKQFTFEPSIITVEAGDEVLFRVWTSDVTHGFYIDGFDVMVEVKPGEVVDVGPLKFDKPGKVKIRCAVTCGPLHPFMTADVVVEPNYTFHGFVVLTLVVAGATLVYINRSYKKSHEPTEE